MMYKLLLKNKKGYTLTELLVAVAILLIVCVIAIPGVGSLRKNLEMTKYDDVARQIFLVSQNKLTTMKACGTLEAFLKKVEHDYRDRKLGTLNRQPQDYDGESDDWKKLYYFTDEDEVFIDYIIGADSILLASMENGGHFLEELNPETGDVYGVFYSEKPFTYDEIEELHTRTKNERKEKMIGYYGGISELSAVANLPQEFAPTVSIVNKEDLYLSIACSEMRKLIKTQDKIVLTVTLTDESFVPENASNHIVTIDLTGGTDFWISNDKVEIQVLLDSIRGGKEGFESITQGKLTPGDNICATVSMTYVNEGVTITGSAPPLVTNSLFASKDDDNLAVAYVRHLNNLRSEAYSFSGAEGVTISQTAAIDYDYNHWDDGVMIDEHAGEVPYTGTFAPIKNAVLFNHITFNGNNNELLNFDISGTDNVGLFSSLQNCALTDMKLVNFNVSGNAFVGALVGQMVGGSITNCGVYLETRDEYNRPVMDMADRVQRYKITGTDYVGGLVGRITGAGTSGSFAAINVSGNSYVGGFCGQYNNGSVLNSYASGKVNATLYYAGGFAGETTNSSLNECYATADVTYVPYYAYAGGFVGRAANGSVTNCNSYGLVERSDGTIDSGTSGGFVGSSTASFHNCKYLSQANYNSKYSSATGISPKGFPELKVSGNLADNCYPYSDELVDNAMPFQMLTTGAVGIIPHYGDWPAQLKLQTSLVYYEKYATADAAGNYYGYYAETSLTAEGEGLETGEVNSWKVDTLRQESCVEDGYALMSVFALTKFTYRLNDDINSAAQTVTVLTDTAPGTNKAVKITNKVSLEFYNTVDSSRYTISNAMVYQFPFSLQMTDRNTAARFYDRLTMTGYIDERVMFENYTFFYCPDFAKNAINPDISETAAATPKNPTGETKPIYVRSPRQINELGRAGYYWNTTLWTDSQDTRYYFKQENDIDFAKYTKTYCGVSYDLMDTSEANEYRNKPIGRPNTYNAKNFRNIYDGQGYRIIDYCCVTTQADGYQFTGLFGEMQGAKLKNIVMVASDPENESGKVISRYNGSSNHAGVGALIGLVYVGQTGYDDNEQYRDDDAYSYASVTNCSVSGYTVSYAPTGKANQPCAVGGLAGYNFGKIENCSAVSKLVTANANSNNKTRYIGGLVGSINGRGSITNSYAGGVVNGDKYTSTTYLAGICAGIDNIYGAYYTQSNNRSMPIKNVYSYCTWENGEIYGVPYAVINKQDKMTLQNGCYLTDTVGSGVTLSGTNISTGRNFSGLSTLSFAASGTAVASGRATSQNTHPWSASLNSAAYSFPALVKNPKTGDYVHFGDWYYESMRKDSGYLTYYEVYSDGTYACSYINGDNALANAGTFDTTNAKTISLAGYGILRLSEDTGVFKVNDTTLVLQSVLKSGIAISKGIYNLYSLSESSENLLLPEGQAKSREIQFQYDEVEDANRNPLERTIYVNAAYANALSTTALEASAAMPLKVRTDEQLQNMTTAASGWHIKLDHDITANSSTGNITNAGYVFEGGYLAGGSAKAYNGYKTGSNGNHIFGLTMPLFSTIATDGTVSNLALIGVSMNTSADKMATVGLINYGTIQNCFATGTISTTTTSLGSAGFVFENNGTITTSYSNIDLSNGNGETAGFALRNNGSINNCYALGEVTSTHANASGFVGGSLTGSSIRNCYTLAEVSGSQSCGFAPYGTAGITASTCFWGKDKNLNSTITNSAGTSKKLSQMKTVFTSGAWTITNTGATWGNTMSGDYPYPRISILDHCGDWPVEAQGRVGVIKLYYKRNGNGRGYYGNGVMIDLDDMTETTLQKQGSAATYYDYVYYGIVFDSDFAKDLSGWEAEYTYYSGGWEDEETISLSTSSDVTLVNSNASDLTTNVFWVNEEYYNLEKITIRNIEDGTEYVFQPHNQSFRYIS